MRPELPVLRSGLPDPRARIPAAPAAQTAGHSLGISLSAQRAPCGPVPAGWPVRSRRRCSMDCPARGSPERGDDAPWQEPRVILREMRVPERPASPARSSVSSPRSPWLNFSFLVCPCRHPKKDTQPSRQVRGRMSPSRPSPGTQLAVRLELPEDRPPQAFLPGNLLDSQHGSIHVSREGSIGMACWCFFRGSGSALGWFNARCAGGKAAVTQLPYGATSPSSKRSCRRPVPDSGVRGRIPDEGPFAVHS